ncbi:histidine phosphatase family protein [Rufibacter roseus]|uniref:Histidine phosphatase family protein n=1 Tax=Rufibacter roseus TaxID=1567108 RepID=A0ABW2DRQ7_9BACT|nr:histidine phosphatase family protein [Rufibacter roseus]
MSLKKIYLIRHGQTDLNLQGIVQGSGVDSSLNDTGRWQADKFFDAYQHVPFDKIYTSALQRSVQSVQKFIDLGIPHERHAGLNEISWGHREGTRITPEEDAYYYEMLERWNQGETDVPIEGGESPQQVADRQKPVLDLILSRPEEETILVCMHGRAMRVLLAQILNYPLHQMDRFVHQNLCLYLLNHTGSMYWVERFADVSHLA